MTGPRIGSLCSGYGGLDMGVQAVYGGSVAWHVEYDRDPAKILAHHWPHIPNHGDVKATNWANVEPVDILTAGYPCQPFSHAGKRKGTDDPRHLWPDVARAISVLRPRLVVLENVRGHVSLGLADVLADLSGLGYDATWGVVRAADAGAPHGRARIFIVATDTEHAERDGIWASTGSSSGHDGGAVEAATDTRGGSLARAAAARHGLSVASERGDQPAPHPSSERHGRGQDSGGLGRLDSPDAGTPRERQRTRGITVDRGAAPAADAGHGREPDGSRSARREAGERESVGRVPGIGGEAATHSGGERRGGIRLEEPPRIESSPRRESDRRPDSWGVYAPAIHRWEHVLGRPAPDPTEPGRNGPRLAPAFVEWLMGLPAGHVTDVPDLSRNAQLKALGNGVVPQQAALALRLLASQEAAA